MKQRIATILLMLCLTLDATAQFPPGQAKEQSGTSSITINIADLGCTTSAGSNTFVVTKYSFGATQTSGGAGGGGGAGKANISALNAARGFDECSPALFGAVVTGKHFPSVDLIQKAKSG